MQCNYDVESQYAHFNVFFIIQLVLINYNMHASMSGILFTM